MSHLFFPYNNNTSHNAKYRAGGSEKAGSNLKCHARAAISDDQTFLLSCCGRGEFSVDRGVRDTSEVCQMRNLGRIVDGRHYKVVCYMASQRLRTSEDLILSEGVKFRTGPLYGFADVAALG